MPHDRVRSTVQQPWGRNNRSNRSPERLIGRLDRLAGRLNPFLAAIAIGLAILDASCLLALWGSNALPISRGAPSATINAPLTGAFPN